MENLNNKKETTVEITPEILPQEPINASNINDTDAPGKTIEITGDDIIETPNNEKEEENLNKDNKTNFISSEPKILDQNGDIGEKKNTEKETSVFSETPIEILKKDSVEEKKETDVKEKKGEKILEKKESGEEEKKTLLKTVRTYQDDVVKTMKEQKTSLTKMVVAEKKKQQDSGIKILKETKLTKKTMFIGVIILSLVIVSGFASFYFLKESQPKIPPTITELEIPTFIFPNYIREIFLTSLKRDKIINSFESEKKSISIPLGSIIQLYLTKEDATEQFIIEETEGNKLLVTTESFLKTIETKAPSSLIRSLGSDFMFGYHSSLGNNPFLIFKIRSYNNAFSGMLEWEKTMFNDLSPTFIKENSNIDTTTDDFQDVIIANKDVRAILNNNGKIEFAYAFPNKETLVIINNETTFQELVRRITNANLERK